MRRIGDIANAVYRFCSSNAFPDTANERNRQIERISCKSCPCPSVSRIADHVDHADYKRNHVENDVPKLSPIIHAHNRIIITISEEILVGKCGRRCRDDRSVIHTDQPSRHRVIVTAVQVVEAGFGIVVVATVAEGVRIAERRIASTRMIAYFPCYVNFSPVSFYGTGVGDEQILLTGRTPSRLPF